MFGDISNKLSVKGAKTSTSSDDPYGDKDEIRSVYSVDPDMLEKLQIKKPKKGEEMSNYDAQKVNLIFICNYICGLWSF